MADRNCDKCRYGMNKDIQTKLAEKAAPVEYVVHEGILWRMERTQKRLVAIIIVLITLLAASWLGFFIYESQFEDVSVTQDVDTGEGDAIIAGVGDVNYGEGETNSQG